MINLLFVHIPKTAGTSIACHLPNITYMDHFPLLINGRIDYTRMNMRYKQPRYYEYTSFSIVRHPVDRFLSAYTFLLHGGIHPIDRHYQNLLHQLGTLDNVIDQLQDLKTRIVHFLDQYIFICDLETGNILVDHVIHFENLSTELKTIHPQLTNLAHHNKTEVTQPTLTIEQIRRIESVYFRDFEVFGYDKKE